MGDERASGDASTRKYSRRKGPRKKWVNNDNPKCVNPGHLFPGTASDNQKDCAAKGRNVYGGRGRKLGAEERQAIVDRFNDGLSLCKLADETGVSRRTITHLLETAGAYPRKAS